MGANHGSFSALASKRVGPSGLVVAFEPQPTPVPLVRRTLAEAAQQPPAGPGANRQYVAKIR